MSLNRMLKYSLAINEAIAQMMEGDPSVFLIGQGVKSPWYVGATTTDLIRRFGSGRVLDTPVSENLVTGAAVGAALAGSRPIVVHPRMDFMLYAMDPIINQAANWCYMSGGKESAPVVFWCIINRGGEQAAQHSQALHAMLGHAPGLKVVLPSSAYDAKGLMIAAIKDDNPVVFIDDRWLYNYECIVPENEYTVPIGEPAVVKEGTDITIISVSFMTIEAVRASEKLSKKGVSAEVIDLRSLTPLNDSILVDSVKKTGRLIVADTGWKSYGAAAEIVARMTETVWDYFKSPPHRITLPDIPAPASSVLENAYYPNYKQIIKVALDLVE